LIRKKPLDRDREGMVHQVGFIVLIILVLIVSYNDVHRLIEGGGFFK
jgi:regulator of sigma E protease